VTVREYPFEIDGDVFHPIPEAWIAEGDDWDEDQESDHRLYAVSAAPVCGSRSFKIRYCHPRTDNVLIGWSHAVPSRNSVPSIEGKHPRSLLLGQWPRSVIPQRDPDDRQRIPEDKHIRALWGERVADIPTEADVERELMADGGPTIDFGGDLGGA